MNADTQMTPLAPTPSDANTLLDNESKALQGVTTVCHAILNSLLLQPKTKPSWFDDLNAELDAAKALAKEWVDDLAPEMTSFLPQQVIHYGTTCVALTGQIESILQPLADKNPTPHQRQVVPVLLEALSQDLEKISQAAVLNYKRIEEWNNHIAQVEAAFLNAFGADGGGFEVVKIRSVIEAVVGSAPAASLALVASGSMWKSLKTELLTAINQIQDSNASEILETLAIPVAQQNWPQIEAHAQHAIAGDLPLIG